MSLPGAVRHTANMVLLGLFGFIILVALLTAIGYLSFWLLPLSLVFLFLLGVYFAGGNVTGGQLILGILIFFILGLGLKFFVASAYGFDPAEQAITRTLSAMRLAVAAVAGTSLSDAQFSQILGFTILIPIVLLALYGVYVQSRRRR